MSKLKEKLFQVSNLWHVGAVVAFLLIAMINFYPAMSGYSVDQPDVTKWVGASQEIKDYVENEGQPGWTNAMFSGMPSTQIMMTYEGRAISNELRAAFSLWLPTPISLLFVYFLSFYIMALSFKIKPYIAIIGALAFGFSSSHIIIIEAGHVTKAMAIGYAPLLIAGFNFAYRWKNWILGAGLAALFMSFELLANHLQITYYMAFVLVGLGIVELVKTVKSETKTMADFGKRTGAILLAYGLALMINIGNITGTSEYGKYTTRGGTDLTISASGENNDDVVTSGLDREYITSWSYGKGETFTFLVPNFKGGETMKIMDNESNKDIVKAVPSQFRNDVKSQNQYFGDQPFTSGPVYLGAIVFLLAILGLVYSNDKARWALLAVTILTVMLSWGKNFMPLTDLFLDYMPGYNKFRAVTILLAVAQLCVPLLGVLFLHRLIKAKDEIKENMKPLLIVGASIGGLLLIFLAVPGMFNSFLSTAETEMLEGITNPQQADYVSSIFTELENARISIFRADVVRSLLFVILGFGIIVAFVRGILNKYAMAGVLAVLVMLDLGLVSKRYLGTESKGRGYEQWTETWKQKFPYQAGNGDLEIFNREVQNNPELLVAVDDAMNKTKAAFDKDTPAGQKNRVLDWAKFRTLNRLTNYRVFDLANPFNSSYASYFHKSVGGYHGAKLGRYQELIEFQLGNQNPSVMDMLNLKYQIASQYGQSGKVENSQFVGENATAMGNAWFSKNIKAVNSADEEIMALTAQKAFTLETGPVFPILVNGAVVNGQVNVTNADQVSFVNTVQTDSTVVLDTMLIEIPFQAITTDKLAYIPDPQQGTLTWAYDNMLDSSFMKIIIVGAGGREGWDPREETVVGADFISNLSKESYSGEGTISMTSYNPDELVYTSSSNDAQLAVFSEIYYPIGWKAYVDGAETPITRVNFTLRALELPAGEHEIKFVYSLPSYERSSAIAWSGSILMLLLIGAGIFAQTKMTGLPEDDEKSEEELA